MMENQAFGSEVKRHQRTADRLCVCKVHCKENAESKELKRIELSCFCESYVENSDRDGESELFFFSLSLSRLVKVLKGLSLKQEIALHLPVSRFLHF